MNVIFGMGKQSMDAIVVDFITNFDIRHDGRYCSLLYCTVL